MSVQSIPGVAGLPRGTHLTVPLLLAVLGCSAPELTAVDEFETVCYRGQRVIAERRGDDLFVDGDLEVTEFEQWCPEDSAETRFPGTKLQGRRAPAEAGTVWPTNTYGVVWPSGIVPFEIDSGFTPTQQGDIQDAMDDWEEVSPGVSFRPRNGDTSWIRFVPDSSCSSGYGKITGQRTIKLNATCVSSFSVHHEIGHALGLQHEHTRSDRNSFVTVSSGSANFLIDSGADMFEYDFDSVMHYSFSSSLSLAPGATVPAGATVGQRTHLSVTDIVSMRAMYPQASTHGVLFANTGHQRLCRLIGREDDISTGFSRTSSLAQLSGALATADTNGLPEADHTVTCTAKSVFWSRDYAYPNATYTEDIGSADPDEVQSYESVANVRVLNRGLVAVLF